MKILYRGTPPSERPWRGKCHYCKSELEVTRDEVDDIYHGDQREPGASGHVVCPICHCVVNVYERAT